MKTKLFAVIIVVFIFFIGALMLEGVARLLSSGRSVDVVPPEVGQFDKMLGWSLKPNSRAVSNRTGYDIEYRINSKGLRDDETSYKKPEGIFRIVLLGDSNAFGFGVPINKHFSTLLEGYFKDVEVINMGVNGYGVDQELLFLRSEGFRYEPDLVLAYVPHYAERRHMYTKRFGKNKPRFVLVDGKLVLTNSRVSDDSSPPPNIFGKIDGWFLGHSKAYEIIRHGLDHLISHEPKESPITQNQKEENLETEEFRKEVYDLGAAIVYAMHKESSAHGATFVLVTKIKELHEASLNNHILSLNVHDPLDNSRFKLPDNGGHINESGNGVLAWEISKFLQTNHLIPAKHLKAD